MAIRGVGVFCIVDLVAPYRARQRSSTAPSFRGCVPHSEKIARQKKEADDLRAAQQKARLANKATFRP